MILKPGPFINSEWPRGVGSYGAIPEWFKQANPNALARQPDGSFFSTDFLGRADGHQPSYYAPQSYRYAQPVRYGTYNNYRTYSAPYGGVPQRGYYRARTNFGPFGIFGGTTIQSGSN